MVVVAFVLSLLALTATLAGQDRPNILWLTSEDNSHHWLGCYGNAQARTPNLDRLAAEGVRYRYAYANAPVCAVARFTIITGRYAVAMGTHNMRSRYPIPARFGTYVAELRRAGYYCVNRSKTDYNFKTNDRQHWDECSGRAHWRNRRPGQPFFAVFNTTISHESSLFAARLRTSREKGAIPATPRLDPASVELPPFLPDTPEIRRDWVTYADVVTAMDQQIGSWLQQLAAAGLAENTIVFYYSDHGGILPRHKRYLNDTGTHVPLLVRFPKKWAHLAPGAAGTTCDRPVSFIDLPPTVLSLAGVEIPKHMQGRAFLGAGRQQPEPYVFLFGQRFDERMLRFMRGVTDGRYRYLRNFHPHRTRGILGGYAHGQAGWRSFYAQQRAGKTTPMQAAVWTVPQPVEELYDTQADPWEVHDLAADPRHRERLERMRAALLAKMREVRDTGLVPEAMYNGISKRGTVFDYVQAAGFPYDQVLELALLAGDGKAALPRLLQAMQHDHPVIRYWGAIGCRVRGAAAAPAKVRLGELLRDPVPAVRIAAGSALAAAGDAAAGTAALVEVLRTTDDEMVALEALNVADELDVAAQIPAEVYQRACKTGRYPGRLRGEQPRPRQPRK